MGGIDEHPDYADEAISARWAKTGHSTLLKALWIVRAIRARESPNEFLVVQVRRSVVSTSLTHDLMQVLRQKCIRLFLSNSINILAASLFQVRGSCGDYDGRTTFR